MIYQGLQNTSMATRFKPELRVPNPADMKQTQNFGHNAVFPLNKNSARPANSYQTQEIYNPQHRQPKINDSKSDNDDMHVIKSCHENTTSLPKEYWACPDVFMKNKSEDSRTGWKDVRNEITREHKKGENQSARELKYYELSSSLFDKNRLKAQPATNTRGVLLSSSAHFLNEDSSGKVNTSCSRPNTRDAQTSETRFRDNLRASNDTGFPVTAHEHEETISPRHDGGEENPRRRHEKNFSDILGGNTEPPAKIVNRVEATSTQNCSWLDARSEICYRNKNPHAIQSGGDCPQERKAENLQSKIFGQKDSSPPPAPREPIDRGLRACFDTNELMTHKSELARSQRKVQGIDVEANGNGFLKSAFGRKQLNLSSNDINRAVGKPARDIKKDNQATYKWGKQQESRKGKDGCENLYEKQINGVPLRTEPNFKDHHSAARIKQLALHGSGNILL